MRGLTLCVLLMGGCGVEEVEGGDSDDPGPAPGTPVVVPDEGPATVEAYLAGAFDVLPDYVGPTDMVYGKALAVRYVDGSSEVSVQVSGLTASTLHNVHVHTQPCAYYAGPHYQLDPAIEETLDTNEIWPSFTTDAEGDGWTSVAVAHALRGDALSVIVHDPVTNDKLACADLTTQVTVGERASGSFASFADADPVIDATLGGTAEMTVSSTSTTVTVALSGLDEASPYTAHVHALPCDTTYGGGHYKLDPTVEDALPDNEIWPEIEVAAGGSSSATVTLQHAARADAQAIVLHRGGPKVGCADLTRQSYVGHTALGMPMALPAAAEKGVDGITGTGTIQRRLDGLTVVEVALEGLASDTDYPIHLHNQACGAADGGGHYLIDPALGDGDEANEIWVSVTSDSAGMATSAAYAAHVARADAQALVLHDADDGARLACIDLL